MNDEYLWQKTGEDPETMHLENTLAVFRYREDDPPAVPTTTKPAQTRRWRFALAFAVPAFAAVVVATLMWLPITDGSGDDDITFIHHPEPRIIEQPAVDPLPIVQPPAPAKQPVRRGEVQPTIVSLRRRRPVARTNPRKTSIVALTKEERYAYDQLMLALSISSSKINIVRNAINGVEETDNDTKQNNR